MKSNLKWVIKIKIILISSAEINLEVLHGLNSYLLWRNILCLIQPRVCAHMSSHFLLYKEQHSETRKETPKAIASSKGGWPPCKNSYYHYSLQLLYMIFSVRECGETAVTICVASAGWQLCLCASFNSFKLETNLAVRCYYLVWFWLTPI